jgi:hypothetical protein
MVVLGIEDGKVIKVVEVSARLRVCRDLRDFWGADLTKRSLAYSMSQAATLFTAKPHTKINLWQLDFMQLTAVY